MDEYKHHLYSRLPHTYDRIDVGDISAQLAVRERLQCKSFKWFMEEIAFDLPLKYPPVEPPDFASGAIQNLAHPNLCADTMSKGIKDVVGLYTCAEDKVEPQRTQYFALSWHKDIRVKETTNCWDVISHGKNAPIYFYDCHGLGGNQAWRYDYVRAFLKLRILV